MASKLTATADFTKKGVVFLGIGIIAFIVLRFTFQTAWKVCCVRPSPSPTPYMNAAYGVLPALALPDTISVSQGKQFALETIDGRVPESTGSATVYEILKKSPELDYVVSSENLANKLSFGGVKAVKNSDTTFAFLDPADPNKRLEIDFIYKNINFRYDNLAAYVSLVRGATPTIERARSEAMSYLGQARPELRNLKGALVTEKDITGHYVYLDPTIQQTTPVNTQLQANMTLVNIPRLPVNGVPIISPYTTKSLINFTYTGVTTSASTTNFQTRLLNAEITYWELNNAPRVLGVYPLRSAQQAWNTLNSGKGIILSPSNSGDQYNVRYIYLAYYEPPIYQPYLQPVWVFEGDKPQESDFQFRAIVPAVQEQFASGNF